MASRASVDARLFTWPSDRSEASALPIFYSLATGSSGDSAGVGTSEIEPPRLRRLSLFIKLPVMPARDDITLLGASTATRVSVTYSLRAYPLNKN